MGGLGGRGEGGQRGQSAGGPLPLGLRRARRLLAAHGRRRSRFAGAAVRPADGRRQAPALTPPPFPFPALPFSIFSISKSDTAFDVQSEDLFEMLFVHKRGPDNKNICTGGLCTRGGLLPLSAFPFTNLGIFRYPQTLSVAHFSVALARATILSQARSASPPTDFLSRPALRDTHISEIATGRTLDNSFSSNERQPWPPKNIGGCLNAMFTNRVGPLSPALPCQSKTRRGAGEEPGPHASLHFMLQTQLTRPPSPLSLSPFSLSGRFCAPPTFFPLPRSSRAQSRRPDPPTGVGRRAAAHERRIRPSANL